MLQPGGEPLPEGFKDSHFKVVVVGPNVHITQGFWAVLSLRVRASPQHLPAHLGLRALGAAAVLAGPFLCSESRMLQALYETQSTLLETGSLEIIT